MIRTGASIFFKNKLDYESVCSKRAFGMGYEYKGFPIQYPSKFPAAFEFISAVMYGDPDGQAAYMEKDFDKAYFAAKLGLESQIKQAKEDLVLLESYKNEYDIPF